jgi:uncharacterized protein YecE (DUF72 family)
MRQGRTTKENVSGFFVALAPSVAGTTLGPEHANARFSLLPLLPACAGAGDALATCANAHTSRAFEEGLRVTIWIGTSGWSYPHWRDTFYPPGLPQARQLAYVSEQLDSVEINRSFYSLLTPNSCRTWREETPGRFVFALKGGRFITHTKKLRDVETALANFFAAGPLLLGRKLGPVVWQLPATLRFDAERVASFFALLPRTSAEAVVLARRHDQRVKEPALPAPTRLRLRHAIEPRHESFSCPEFARLAASFQVAIAVADSAEWPLIEEMTTDFMYVRLHGGERTYRSAYDADAIERWAARIEGWLAARYADDARRIGTGRPRKVRDVFVYFDNDAEGHAPRDALALARRLLPA